MHKCPVQGCIRAFDDPSVLKQHVNRRHAVPKESSFKLPSINKGKSPSQEKKTFQIRRSSSKGKKQMTNVSQISQNKSKLAVAIEGQRILESEKIKKRPSLSKKSSITDQALPDLKQTKPRKLQTLQMSKNQNPMNRTMPSFGSLQLRQRKPKEQQQVKVETNQDAFTKTLSNFTAKQTKFHRPLKHLEKKTSDSTKRLQEMKLQPQKKIQSRISARDKTRQSPAKKQQKKQIAQLYDFQQRIVVFKSDIQPRLVMPSHAKSQFIYANNCNLKTVQLNSLQTLLELSLVHNHLTDISFLNYSACRLQKLYIDHNSLTNIDFLPKTLVIFSAKFNQICNIDSATLELARTNMTQLDFSFNPIRNEPNYKVRVVSCCFKLKKLDGMKITQFDKEMAGQYERLVDEQMGLIPRKNTRGRLGSPSTVVSLAQDQAVQEVLPSQWYLEAEIRRLQKMTKQTLQSYNIIKQENQTLNKQIDSLVVPQTNQQDPTVLYNKLKTQCQTLQLLSFMQYASEEQLQQLIRKKQMQIQ